GAIKDGERVIGNRTRVKIVKNKCAPPFRQAELDILYGEGMSLESDLVDLGLERNLIAKAGSWFSLGETRIGQGKESARLFLKEHPDVARKLEADLRAAAGLPSPKAGPTAVADAPTPSPKASAAAAETP